MSVLNNSLLLGQEGGAGYVVQRSLRFSSIDSAFLSYAVPSGTSTTFTASLWIKRSSISATYKHFLFTSNTANSGAGCGLGWTDGNAITVYNGNHNTTSAVYRDVSAWYYITLSVNAGTATLYVNGVQQVAGVTGFQLNGTAYIGRYITNAYYFDGYMADIYLIDGQALTPSSFTEVSATTGQLIPKAYSGSFGTNGFWLKFSDNSAATATTLGKDYSGNNNNWSPSNLSVTAGAGNDSLVDTPTSYGTDDGLGGSVRGNYCTWNPLTGAITLTNGNLAGNSTGGAWRGATGTAGVLSGKWYWESTIQNTDSGNYYGEFGFIKTTDITGAITFPSGMNGIVYYARNGRKISGGTSVVTSSSGATTGDIVQVAVDLDAGKIWFGVNNTWIDSGNPASGTGAAYTGISGTYLPVVGVLDGGTCNTNFGQRQWAYAAPAGFKALCDTNLPAPVIAKPNTVMDVALYTGTSATQTVTLNGAFSPDLVWIKQRNGGTDHALFDVIRGSTAALQSSTTAAEQNLGSGNSVTLGSTGFTLGADTAGWTNYTTRSYVAWAFDAGSSTVSNTAGSITSQVRANASAGFSVVTAGAGGYFGGTLGHGLGVAPGMIILKDRNGATGWRIYHSSLGNNFYLDFTTAAASNYGSSLWGVTSSVFGSNAGLTNTAVAYCFAPVAGYSAFGSYTGNGSSDGPFVFCGFRPRWILVKRTDGVIQWTILDTARSPSNVADQRLFPNLSQAETVNGDGNTDLLSNGFKPRNIDSAFNANGGTYIYAAFAESPFQYARAR